MNKIISIDAHFFSVQVVMQNENINYCDRSKKWNEPTTIQILSNFCTSICEENEEKSQSRVWMSHAIVMGTYTRIEEASIQSRKLCIHQIQSISE